MKRAIIALMSAFIAIDVGGTQIRVATFGEEGIIPQNIARIPTQSSQATALERLIDLIASVWPVDSRVAAIAMAAPGPVDPKQGIIFSAPNIPGWLDLPLKTVLEDRFRRPVVVGNDANLAAVGEWKYGAGQGYHNLIYFTISTGIGGGIICEDHLLLGETGLAGEVGHVTVLPDGPICGCGQRGHLEAVASGTAIARYVAEQLAAGRPSILSALPSPTARDVSKAAGQGDALAIEALTRAGKFMGLGLTNYLHIFNPSAIILGGGVSRSGPYFMDPLYETMRQSVMDPEYLRNLTISPAALGDEAGLLGALATARASIREVI